MNIHRNFVILLACSMILAPLLIISDYRIKNNISVEMVPLETRYIHPITGTNQHSEFQINILTPSDASEENITAFPAVIILHGDTIGSESTIMVQRELIDNGFLVVIVEIETYETYRTILELNSTLEYLLTRTDVNSSQICMYGHSHGGLYSLLFSAIRNDVIQGVISANYAEWDNFYLKVRILDAELIPDLLENYSPSRVLFTLDENDDRTDDESHDFYSNLDPITDVQFFLSSTSFGHASGVYYPEALYTQISWLNSILGRNLLSPAEEVTSFQSLISIQRSFTITFILIGCELILLVLILRNLIWLFSNQEMYFMKCRRLWGARVRNFRERLNAKNAEEKPTQITRVSEDPRKTIPFSTNGVKSATSSSNQIHHPALNVRQTESLIISSNESVWDNEWNHMRFWRKKDAAILNPSVMNDTKLHQKYSDFITNMSTKSFSSKIIVVLGIILIFQLFLTFIWRDHIGKSQVEAWIVLYLADFIGQNTAIFIDSFFTLPFMWFWVGLFIFIGYFQIRTKELHELGDYSAKHTIKGWGVALEIFIVFFFLLQLISRNYTGNLLEVLALRNLIPFLLFLKFFNLFSLEFFYERIKSSKLVYWKSMAMNLLILGWITLFEYFFIDTRLNIPLLVGLVCIIFLNPTIYRFTENSKTATLFDYLLLIVIFSLFRF